MAEYITRLLSSQIMDAHKYYPVIVLTGPRQSGKTSLCRHLFPDYKYVNLEDITTRTNAMSDITRFIDSLGDKCIIDEAQNVPDIMSMIQVRVDENKERKYILTGSSNFTLLKTISQSLAGRAALFTLLPFSFLEMGETRTDVPIEKLLYQGQYPAIIADGELPRRFYRNYYNTYVERDLRSFLQIKNLVQFDTFIRLLATRCGSEFNASNLAREVGVSVHTINEWLSILVTSYIVYSIRPYFSNMGKSLTKMPKVYFYDTGILCFLLGLENADQLTNSPFRGAIFENMAMGELLKSRYNTDQDLNLYYYRERSGKEVDALIAAGGKISLYEFKASKTFSESYLTNMKQIKEKLKDVDTCTVIYDGQTFAPISVNIRTI